MAHVEEVEQAVLDAVTARQESLPKTIIDDLQRRPDFTDALVAEAIWRLVANRRVQLTKALRLRVHASTASTSF
jgi:hypothetical protein